MDIKKIYTIQGNIGSGKSNLLNRLSDNQLITRKEPIELWSSLLNKTNIQRGADYGLHLQTRICTSLALRENAEWLEKKGKSIFIERDLDSAKRIFIPVAKDYNILDQEGIKTLSLLYQTLSRLEELKHKEWERNYQTNIRKEIIYLRSNPLECYRRIKLRGQAGDQEITLKYIESLHAKHEEWLIDHNENIIILEESLTTQDKIDYIMKLQTERNYSR